MRTRTTMTKTTSKGKIETESPPSSPPPPLLPPTPHPLLQQTHHLCNPPSQAPRFYWRKTVPDLWAEWSCTPHPLQFFSTHHLFFCPHGTESHPWPLSFSGSPRHSAFHNFCQSLFIYSRVRTLGLVSSFGSVLLIICWMIYIFFVVVLGFIISLQFFFPLIFFRSFFFLFPSIKIAIAAVQPASHCF